MAFFMRDPFGELLPDSCVRGPQVGAVGAVAVQSGAYLALQFAPWGMLPYKRCD